MNEVSIIINGVRYDAVESDGHKCEGCAFLDMCNEYDTNCGFIEEMHGKYHFVKSTKSFEP